MKKLRTIMSLLLAALLIVSAFPDCNTKAESSVKTGIIGAMDEEVDSLKKAVSDAKTTSIGSMEFCEGMLDGQSVVIVKCGVGKVNAGNCAQILISIFGVNRIINTGVAGSLDASIDIGDIVVSTDAVQHDFDLTPLGYAPGALYEIGSPSLPADVFMRESAVNAVKQCAPEVHVFEGRVCTGDQFIASAEQKDAIIAVFAVSAVKWKAVRLPRFAVRMKCPSLLFVQSQTRQMVLLKWITLNLNMLQRYDAPPSPAT